MKKDLQWGVIFLSIAAIVSTCYLLILGYFALPTADDLGWARQVSDSGIGNFVKKTYFDWQGRYSALFVDGLLCKWLGWNEHLLLYTIVELCLGYFAIFLVLKSFTKCKTILCILSSIVLVNLGLLALPEIGTFYWLCTSNYIHEIWFSIYLFWLIIYCENKCVSWPLSIVFSIYLGGCSENYSPLVVIMLGCLFIVRLIRIKHLKFWMDEQALMSIICALVVLAGFCAMLFAPGNDVRMASEGQSKSFMEHFSFVPFMTSIIKASVIIGLRLLSRGVYFVLMIPIFIFLGHNSLVVREMNISRALVSLFVLCALIGISVAAAVFGLGWYATMRANCYMVFLAMVWLGYVFISTGNKVRQKHISIIVLAIGCTINSCLIGYYTILEFPVVRDYHNQVVIIHHSLQEYVREGNNETISVRNVSIPYMQNSYSYLRNALQIVLGKTKRYYEPHFVYEPFKLEEDPLDWRNIFYKQWLYADFDIIGLNSDENECVK